MLKELAIRDMVLIDTVDLDFATGLSVLTGETGAGKSILLDCLGFVLGWRGRGGVVRNGADTGEVTAVFELGDGHPALEVLEKAAIPIEGDELILRRVVTAAGTKRGFANDRRVSGEVLNTLAEHLVELHGQSDDGGLLNVRGHRRLLDAYAGCQNDVAATQKAWSALHEARQNLTEARTAAETAAKDADFLSHSVQELETLAPELGEEPALDSRRRLIKSAEAIADDVGKAAQALGSDGAETLMGDALRWLEGVSDKAEGQLEAPLDALSRAMDALADAHAGVEAVHGALGADAGSLEVVEERLFAIRALARKHEVLPDELPGLSLALREKLDALTNSDAWIADLEQQVSAAKSKYDAVASKLSKARQKASKSLDALMAKELPPLKMERAQFHTNMDVAEAGPDGIDQVQFLIATAPGAKPGPLAKIASGGELARFLLALKICLARDETAMTLIFDEIDRGVGGATADAVGRRLARIAEQHQVLVVTHSPQVAACGGQHFQVSKSVDTKAARTDVLPLLGDARRDEIARMLSGDVINDAARAAADALIEGVAKGS